MIKYCLLALMTVLALSGLNAADAKPAAATDDDAPYNSPQRFRLGEIVDSGVSKREINIFSREKIIVQPNFRNKVYAVVRVKLDPERSISIHDFTLIYNYQAFDCIAVKPYQNSFNAEKRVYPASRQNNVFDLLFYLDIPDFKPTGELKATLHYRLSGGGLTDVELKMKNFGSGTIQLALPHRDADSSGDNK